VVTPLGATLKHVNKHPNVDSVSVPCVRLQIPCVYTSKENLNFSMLYY